MIILDLILYILSLVVAFLSSFYLTVIIYLIFENGGKIRI